MSDRFGVRREFQCDWRWDDRGWLRLRRQHSERDSLRLQKPRLRGLVSAIGNHSSASADSSVAIGNATSVAGTAGPARSRWARIPRLPAPAALLRSATASPQAGMGRSRSAIPTSPPAPARSLLAIEHGDRHRRCRRRQL
jgi:hypothetical protein